MKRLMTVTVVLATWLCLSHAAFAQLTDNVEINVFGAGSWYSTKNFQISSPPSVTPISGEYKFDRARRGGVRVGVYTRGHWSQEFFYSYEPNKIHINRQTAPVSSIALKTQNHSYGISALYYLNDNESQTFRPFLSIGVGGTI